MSVRKLLDSPRLLMAILFLWVLLLCAIVLRTPSDWWFEDDTTVYAFVASIENPAHFFFDRDVLRKFQVDEIVPMLHLSFWLDHKLAPLNAAFFYWHSVVSQALAAVLLFLVMLRSGGKPLIAFCGACIWTILPAAIASHEFLSARCYIEGLALSCGAVLVASSPAPTGRTKRILVLGALFLLLTLAVLSKEYFPPTVLTAVFLIGSHMRRWSVAACSVVVGALYAGYRLYMIGGSLDYGMPHVGLVEYLRMLASLPYMFAGNSGGYFLIGLGLLACFAAARRRTFHPAWKVAAIVLALSCLTLYPISHALLANWEGHGTWARSTFAVGTVVVILGTSAAAVLPRPWRLALLAVSAIVLIPGARSTYKTWDGIKAHYAAEGRFLIQGSPGLLYSQLPASWFLAGLAHFYPEIEGRYVTFGAKRNKFMLRMLERESTVWVYNHGQVVKSGDLHQALLAECRRSLGMQRTIR